MRLCVRASLIMCVCVVCVYVCVRARAQSVDGDEDRFLQIVGVLEDVIMTPNFKERVETFCKSHCGTTSCGTLRAHVYKCIPACARCLRRALRTRDRADVFENSDENKLEYMPLFEEYTSMVEDAICAAVTAVIPDFDMAEFEDMLTRHAEDLTVGALFAARLYMPVRGRAPPLAAFLAGAAWLFPHACARPTNATCLQGDVFDVLVSLGDFEEFKSLMISYKEQLHWERSGMPVATHASSAGASSAAPAAPALRMSPIVLPSHAGLAPTIIPLGK
ncbi:hypothetical protein EON67_12460 [archaeon]|nr:MAG: hypothetical protein EON67_12460 [archaeon]